MSLIKIIQVVLFYILQNSIIISKIIKFQDLKILL